MRLFLFLSFIAFSASISSHAQTGRQNNDNLQEKAMRFFVNTLDRFETVHESNVIKEFKQKKSGKIIFRQEEDSVVLLDKLYAISQRSPVWNKTEDRVIGFSPTADSRYMVIAGVPDENQEKESAILSLDVSPPSCDVEFCYIILKFGLAGKSLPWYNGELVCKFNRKSELVKYDFSEGR